MIHQKVLAGILLCVVVLVPSIVRASGLENVNQLLDHVEGLSPDIQKAKATFEVTKQRLTEAKQIPNPELSFGNWSGKAASQKWKQTDITLTQPVELGGKRGNRMNVAESTINQATVELLALTAEVRLKTLFLIYRFRQIQDEASLLKEAHETFSNLVNNYKRRPQLSPEQSTSLFVFELTNKNYDLLIEETVSEYNSLVSEIKILTGYDVVDLAKLLPRRALTWPKFDASKDINSLSLKVISAQTALAENQLKLAKADVWPTVSIGPSYTMQNQFGSQANILGVVFSFPIPVLNQNDGAKSIAANTINSTKKFYEIEKSISENRRINLLKTYQSSVKVLEVQADDTSLHKKHKEIENNFLRGLITSPLVIDSHRQMFEIQRLYHERELKTLDVYYQLVLLQGGKVEAF